MPRDPIYGEAPTNDREVALWQDIFTTTAAQDGSYLPLMTRILHQSINEIWFQHQPATCGLAEDCYICDAIHTAARTLAAHDRIQANNSTEATA
ncbi:hypothetical protein ACNAW0_28715 [Micromonospora sp. SL1-18]|uniref:hypothetical protein n=1 Tax=Micromonospora sp. SL1-18 TaxID=3399128 RepID=UPI003A4D477E